MLAALTGQFQRLTLVCVTDSLESDLCKTYNSKKLKGTLETRAEAEYWAESFIALGHLCLEKSDPVPETTEVLQAKMMMMRPKVMVMVRSQGWSLNPDTFIDEKVNSKLNVATRH